ncbi:MAG: hypothetical protein JO035_04860 [Betaproteobacteria bacterium]|nr:hypothetical protein [Betaproteobacteria bacterium]
MPAASTPAPTPTPTPTPTPSPSLIHNFGDYVAATNAGGATAPTNATLAAGSSVMDISGGFSRSVLPHTLADLRPSMMYNVAGANVTTINDGGISVDLQGNPSGDSTVNAHADAAAGASSLIWMQAMAVHDSASQGQFRAIASSTANGAGSDAEIGIQHASMAIGGTGAINDREDLSATATAGGVAHTLIGDFSMSVDSTAAGSAAAPVAAEAHMGFGEGQEAGMLASADGAGSMADLAVTGNVALSGQGDDVYVFNSGLFAQGTNGGSAITDVAGDVTFSANGRSAHSYVLVDASTDAVAGSAGDVHVHGNVDLQSIGTESALTRAAVRADGTGTVEIDGHLDVDSSATSATSFMQVISQGSASHIDVGSLGMTMDGAGHGWMDLYTDHGGGLDIGSVNLTAASGADIGLHVQQANTAATGTVDTTFLAHADGTASVSISAVNLAGAGQINMFLNGQTFGTINQAAGFGQLALHYQIADQNFAGIGSAPLTTINGASGTNDAVMYNGVAADGTNFTDAGSFDTLAALNAGLNAALDGTHKYVFAVYTGTEDINANGVADDHNAGVLAYSDSGNGMTSVLMLPGITHLTPANIS